MSGIFDVIYEDGDLVVVNKLAAVPVLPDKSGDSSLKDFVAELRPGKFVEPVHRLDRRTSGAVAFAKTRHYHTELSEAFREHRVTKTFWAVTERAPEPASGTLRHRLVHDQHSNQAKALPADSDVDGELGELAYEIVGWSDHHFLVEITPVAGKAHQIRAQLSAAGFPVSGDLKYGARRSTHNGLIMLHARALTFNLPDRHRVDIIADPPPDEPLWENFESDPQNFN